MNETLISDETPFISCIDDAEEIYRRGNRYFLIGELDAAKKAWQEAHQQLRTVSQSRDHLNLTANYSSNWYIVTFVLLIVCSIYAIIFFLFPREHDPMRQWLQARQDGQPRSLWDDWWDTGRPSIPFSFKPRDDEEWQSILRENLRRFLGKKSEEASPDLKELEKLLELNRKNLNRQKAVNYYVLIGRGFFNARRFDEAISTYQDGLQYASSSSQQGELYRELGTAYYYKGYHLQPDGLAVYDLSLVKDSVESYLKAEQHTQGPYLFGNMGWGFYLLEDFKTAVKYSQLALELDSTLVYVRMNLGISYIRMNEYTKAFNAYKSIVQFRPEPNEYDGGTRDLKELQLQHPSIYPFTKFILGFILMQQGKYYESRKILKSFTESFFPVSLWKNIALNMMQQMPRK